MTSVGGLTAGDLWLHVGVEAAVEDNARVTSILSEIRNLGIRVALDGVGAGRGSLRLLAHLPVDAGSADPAERDDQRLRPPGHPQRDDHPRGRP